MIEVKVKVKVITTCISIIGWNMEEAHVIILLIMGVFN
jgi:hypothetical protein